MQQQKRERDSQVARGAILEAASNIFARDGFGAARVDAIAKESGYNKSLIFQYFGDKLGLYREVVRHAKKYAEEDLLQELQSSLENQEPLSSVQVRDTLATVIRWCYQNLTNNPRFLRILAWETAEGWQTFSLLHAQKSSEEKQCHVARCLTLVTFIRKAQENGHIRPAIDAELLATNMLSICTMHLLSLPRYQTIFPEKDFTSPEALEQAREHIVDLVLHGVMEAQKEIPYATELSVASNDRNRNRPFYGDS